MRIEQQNWRWLCNSKKGLAKPKGPLWAWWKVLDSTGIALFESPSSPPTPCAQSMGGSSSWKCDLSTKTLMDTEGRHLRASVIPPSAVDMQTHFNVHHTLSV